MEQIEINSSFSQVLDFVNHTAQPVFLTGKAGTGKTTLLKYIRQNTFKQVSVVAPTGVAAINAGGSTIHSFFQFPFTPFVPITGAGGEIDYSKTNLGAYKYNSQRLQIFRRLELLVIDEISMVRADMLDQIDICLRHTRRKWHLPFGGVQVLLIGDMYQLPPVAKPEEWSMLKEYYNSPFFFDSFVVRKFPPAHIELDKIYRQNEQTFIALLNKVRNNELDEESMALLNSRYVPDLNRAVTGKMTTLTTHNRKADQINSENLNALPGKATNFKCRISGMFSDNNYPADEELLLKPGARVMFLRNNTEKNYFNGKTGVITHIGNDVIRVKCPGDDAEINVERETWNNISYTVDPATKRITEDIIGDFTQFPLRHAWAITIHKSQGLTFDKLVIDARESFSAGQVYVALSRCRSIKGLILSSRIESRSLMNDENIVGFSQSRHNSDQLESIYKGARNEYTKNLLNSLFDTTELMQKRSELAGTIQQFRTRIATEGHTWAAAFFSRIDILNQVSSKFIKQLNGLHDESTSVEGNAKFQERIAKASEYFEKEFHGLAEDIRRSPLKTESREASGELSPQFTSMFEDIAGREAMLACCKEGFNFNEFIKRKFSVVIPDYRPAIYATAKNISVSMEVKHPALYRSLILLRDEICEEEQKPIYMVANSKTITELANYLPVKPGHLLQISGFGKVRADAWGERFLDVIAQYMKENSLECAMEEKSPALKKKKTVPGNMEGNSPEKKVSTREQTFRLFREGMPLSEIASTRGFALSTIEGHLIPYVASGEISLEQLIAPKKIELISGALRDFSYETGIGPVKNALPEQITWSEIRYVIADKINKGEIVAKAVSSVTSDKA